MYVSGVDYLLYIYILSIYHLGAPRQKRGFTPGLQRTYVAHRCPPPSIDTQAQTARLLITNERKPLTHSFDLPYTVSVMAQSTAAHTAYMRTRRATARTARQLSDNQKKLPQFSGVQPLATFREIRATQRWNFDVKSVGFGKLEGAVLWTSTAPDKPLRNIDGKRIKKCHACGYAKFCELCDPEGVAKRCAEADAKEAARKLKLKKETYQNDERK